jgi:hypothetical protein
MMNQLIERRISRSGAATPDDPAAYDATWDLYDAAMETCGDVQAAFAQAIREVRAGGEPDASEAMTILADKAVAALHALEMAELIRRRAAYDAIVATVGIAAADRRAHNLR